VSVTYDGSKKAAGIKIYVNGALQVMEIQADSLRDTTRTTVPFKIGQRDAGERLPALMLENLRLYGRALTPIESANLAKADRLTQLFSKTADQRNDAERSELFDYWQGNLDPVTRQLRMRLGEMEPAEANIKAAGTIAHAQRVTPPTTPTLITPPAGNSAFLVGHAVGTQGYVCLPTGPGASTASWTINAARPEATLFHSPGGQNFQIVTHFLSPNEKPTDPTRPVPFGNATWQSSFDSSRVWAVKVKGIDPDPSIDSCKNSGSIQCLLLQSVGNKKGPTGGNLLANTTFIQRLNTAGGAVPTTACTAGQTQLVPYTADYFFFRAAKE
jgi:hypothetical protein